MDARAFSIYRLFDAEYPSITRYVGCTDNLQRRLYQHAAGCTASSSLVRAWAAWLKGLERKPQAEIITTIQGTLVEARAAEAENIVACAVDNRWLLNWKQWKADKIAAGIPKRIIEAYAIAVSRDDYSHGGYSYPLGSIARCLESQYPRLRIFRYRYLLSECETEQRPAEAITSP